MKNFIKNLSILTALSVISLGGLAVAQAGQCQPTYAGQQFHHVNITPAAGTVYCSYFGDTGYTQNSIGLLPPSANDINNQLWTSYHGPNFKYVCSTTGVNPGAWNTCVFSNAVN